MKQRGVIYYKNFLPIKLIDVQYSHKSINFELRIEGKVCKFLYLYRSHSPALIQAIFHVGDYFWVQENQHQKIEKQFFSKISSII